MQGDEEETREFASPPCSLHELDPAFAGLAPREPVDLKAWRKEERARIIEARLAIPAARREELGERIAQRLEEAIGDPAGLGVSAYRPFRGEPGVKPPLTPLSAKGAPPARPMGGQKPPPLIFRAGKSGAGSGRGGWNTPIPADGAEVVPDVVISPVVGYDPRCYRLGYGGGFFDRTLASLLPHRPRVFGVGYTMQAIPTIHPQPYDIPMDVIVTEESIVQPA